MNTRIRSNLKKEDLVDIKDVVINPALSKEKRIESFVKQIKNPLCYKCGIYVIESTSAENARPIDECFSEYVRNL